MAAGQRADGSHRVALESMEVAPPDADDADDQPRPARRALVGTAVAVAVVVAALAAGSWWQSWSRDRAVVSAVGGVSSFSSAPRTAWETTTDGGQVWGLGDTLVTVHDDALVGLDAATGEQRWSAAGIGAFARCGPSAREAGAPVTRLVCLTGERSSPTAVVVDRDGTASLATDLGDVGGDAVPGPDASVLRWDRADGTTTVTLQDAIDGTVRWIRTVEPDDVARDDRCRHGTATTTGAVDDGLLVVRGCRISTYLTLAGTRIDDDGQAATVQMVRTSQGGFLRTTATSPSGTVESTRLVRADGTEDRVVAGRPLLPLASDGSADPTRLLQVPSGVESVDSAGHERWSLPGTVERVPVVADGMAVLDQGWVVRGVDLASGTTTWSWDRPDLGTSDTVVTAFTDGKVAVLVLAPDTVAAPARLVALDLHDGRVRWDEPGVGAASGYQAVAGRLVHVAPSDGRVVVHR